MIALNHRSMMNVVPMPKRASDTGAKIIVPNEVIRSPTICAPRPSAAMPK